MKEVSTSFYGLTIHCIQSYIFNTNKLPQIIGGSELIEYPCVKMFNDKIESKEEVQFQAVGTIRFLVHGKEKNICL